jgi:hypothetical protein
VRSRSMISNDLIAVGFATVGGCYFIVWIVTPLI